MVPKSPSGSRTLESYEHPKLLPKRRKALGARILDSTSRGLLASEWRNRWKCYMPDALA